MHHDKVWSARNKQLLSSNILTFFSSIFFFFIISIPIFFFIIIISIRIIFPIKSRISRVLLSFLILLFVRQNLQCRPRYKVKSRNCFEAKCKRQKV